MSRRGVGDEIATFETAVRLINWENGLFLGLFALAFAGTASQAQSAEMAASRLFVASVSVLSAVAILAKVRYRLKAETAEDDRRSAFQRELLRQGNLRRRAPLAAAPLVAALLLNAWVVSSLFSLVLALLVAVCAWLNLYLARMWLRGAGAIELRDDLHDWRTQRRTFAE